MKLKKSIIYKNNKWAILCIIVTFLLLLSSFYFFYKDNFGYSKYYFELKENCYDKKTDNKICDDFENIEQIEYYIENNNPIEKYKKLDSITLTCEIVEHSIFSIMQYLSPLILIIMIVGRVHSEMNSGMFKNYLLRKKYKDYLLDNIKISLKYSLIMPISLLLIFIISCLITRFNFHIDNETKLLAVFDAIKYKKFILYGFFVCIIQYLISISYSIIGIICSSKNKNAFVCIIEGYIYFIIEELLIYILIYAVIINKILGFKNLTDYFNIAGYWFFDGNINMIIILIISFIISVVSIIAYYIYFKNKERIVIENEK